MLLQEFRNLSSSYKERKLNPTRFELLYGNAKINKALKQTGLVVLITYPLIHYKVALEIVGATLFNRQIIENGDSAWKA